jgi:Arc/MetJ-type ribon-helix-helix transcriptional regulator
MKTDVSKTPRKRDNRDHIVKDNVISIVVPMVKTKTFSSTLPENDLAFLDDYSRRHSLGSRAAALRASVRALRDAELESQYVDAFSEWTDSEDSELWETTVADGLEQEGAGR